MPTATRRGRRDLLRQLGVTTSVPLARAAAGTSAGLLGALAARSAGAVSPALADESPARLAAAWQEGSRYCVGILEAAADRLAPTVRIDVPTRAHGIAVERQGTILVAARRPGDWLMRFDPRDGEVLAWYWSKGEYAFNGHVVRSADGGRLYSTETALDTGAGNVAVRDTRSLDLLDRFPSGGLDPHELVVAADGHLWVANGGIETRPETGRTRHGLARMDSSLVRIDPGSGKITGQWRLADSRLGLRHLALSPDGTVGIALQAEHDDAVARRAAPVLALWDRQRGLRSVALPADVAVGGYGGSIAVLGEGFAVACPRSDQVSRWRLADGQARWLAPLQLPQACAMDAGWIGGKGGVLQVSNAGLESSGRTRRWRLAADLRLDNHWSIVDRAVDGPS